jgi:hypothetical protein
MKIRAVGAELFRADGRTDGHDESNSRLALRTGPKKSLRSTTG